MVMKRSIHNGVYAAVQIIVLAAVLGLINATYTAEDVRTLPYSYGFTVNGAATVAGAGTAVGGCDVNGDGLGDIFLSSPDGAGSITVIYGRANGNFSNIDLHNPLPTSSGFTISGGVTPDQEGYSAACAGDTNSDGFGDLVTASPYADYSGRIECGVVHVLYGKFENRVSFGWTGFVTSNSNGYKIYGAHDHDHLGYSVDGAGDMNGDGLSEIIIGEEQLFPPFKPSVQFTRR
jgi:hypothetical protein